MAMMSSQILYSDGITPVELGDEVEFRGGLLLLFKTFQGRIVYLPGVSPLNADMESDGLTWIAIEVPGKLLVRRLVDPETSRLARKTQLLRRNASPVPMPAALAAESDT